MQTPVPQNPPLAVVLMACATAFIAGTTLLAKALGSDTFGPPLHPLQISFGRFLFAFLAISSVAAVLRPKLKRPNWSLHIGRTSFGWMGVSLMFASVAYIPLSDATAITFLNPVFGMMLAIPLLGEKVGPWRWLAAAIALVGALVLLRPTPDSFQPAALLALGAAAFMGMELIFIKKLTGRENPFQVLLVNNAIGVCIATCAASFVWTMPTLPQWGLMAGLGVLMASAQSFFVNSMARADASFVAPFSYGTLIFATFYDLLFYNVVPDAISLTGAAAILGGAILLAYREGLARKRAE